MDTNETKQDAAEMLLKYLEYGKDNNPVYKNRCEWTFSTAIPEF